MPTQQIALREWLPRWPLYFLCIVALITAIYQMLSAYATPTGTVTNVEELKNLYRNADSVYFPLLEDDLFWSFPFPEETKWRKVIRGSYLYLRGTTEVNQAVSFLEHPEIKMESAQTYPTETGRFLLVRGPSTTEGLINPRTGEFRISSRPTVPTD